MFATTIVVIPPIFVLMEMALIVSVPSVLWIISGRWRVRHFARYFHQEDYNTQRYFERLRSIERERTFFVRGAASFFSVAVISGMAACITSSLWSMAIVPAVSSSFLALVDMYEWWLGRNRRIIEHKYNPETRMIGLMIIARVVDTAPFGVSLIMLLVSYVISSDAIVVAGIIGVLASPLPVILAPAALPTANSLLVLIHRKNESEQ